MPSHLLSSRVADSISQPRVRFFPHQEEDLRESVVDVPLCIGLRHDPDQLVLGQVCELLRERLELPDGQGIPAHVNKQERIVETLGIYPSPLLIFQVQICTPPENTNENHLLVKLWEGYSEAVCTQSNHNIWYRTA